MGNPRSNLVSFQCSVCQRVWDGAEWLVERRQEEGVVYALGLCGACKTLEGRPESEANAAGPNI